ncbi:MAG TPA: SRPBCC family protein [Candidatus Caenarcaniphilales bacterium]
MRSHSAWGGAVTAQMYLPLKQAQVWQQLTNYPRWVNYFPDLTHSEVLHTENTLHRPYKYLYQAARKSFFTLSAQVEVYLQVEEVDQQTIEFRLEKGSFSDFSAQLHLQAYSDGTLLTYTVAAILPIPVPSVLLQQMMAFGLPANMAQMRKILCHKVKPAKIC